MVATLEHLSPLLYVLLLLHTSSFHSDTDAPHQYNGIDGGYEQPITGQFIVEGNVDDSLDWVDSMLDAINAAFQASKNCTQRTVTDCGTSKRNPAVPVQHCGQAEITQCTAADWLLATMYDEGRTQKGQVTLTGSSELNTFDCDTFLGIMSGAAAGLDMVPPVQGAIAIASVICGAVSA
jgi:hypothetical protein